MKKNFYLATFVLLLILQLTVIAACLMSGIRKVGGSGFDYAKVVLWFLITAPISLMIIISAVIMLVRYREKKENEEIKKHRTINNS